jgi:DNA modification methylase
MSIRDKFLTDVSAEAERAVKNHGAFNSLHEGYAVMAEEVDELWDIVRQKRSKRNPKEIWEEAVQIAACAAKIAEKFGA